MISLRYCLLFLVLASSVQAQFDFGRWWRGETDAPVSSTTPSSIEEEEDYDFSDITGFGEDLVTKHPKLLKELKKFVGNNGTLFCEPCVSAAEFLQGHSYEVTASAGTFIVNSVCPSLVGSPAGAMFCVFASGAGGAQFGKVVAAAVAKWEPQQVCATLKMC